MCFSCTIEEVADIDLSTEEGHEKLERDGIEWPRVTADMRLLARLAWVLHECTSATTGGPMHIFTDDFNVEDGNLELCLQSANDERFWGAEAHDWPLVQAISRRMCELAKPMTKKERSVAMSLAWRHLYLDEDGQVVWPHGGGSPAAPNPVPYRWSHDAERRA